MGKTGGKGFGGGGGEETTGQRYEVSASRFEFFKHDKLVVYTGKMERDEHGELKERVVEIEVLGREGDRLVVNVPKKAYRYLYGKEDYRKAKPFLKKMNRLRLTDQDLEHMARTGNLYRRHTGSTTGETFEWKVNANRSKPASADMAAKRIGMAYRAGSGERYNPPVARWTRTPNPPKNAFVFGAGRY